MGDATREFLYSEKHELLNYLVEGKRRNSVEYLSLTRGIIYRSVL